MKIYVIDKDIVGLAEKDILIIENSKVYDIEEKDIPTDYKKYDFIDGKFVLNIDKEAKINELEKTQLKLQKIQDLKKNGLDFTLNGTDYKIPLKSKDAMGLIQIKNAFELGVTSTVMYFSNGVQIPLNNKNDLNILAKFFAEKRNLLFTDPEKLLDNDINLTPSITTSVV